MKQLLLMVGAVLLQASWAGELSPLVGDGVSDDTAAIQARLDSGAACVYLPPPKKCYRISKTLRIGSDTELRLDRFSIIRLAPDSDCPMIENRGYVGGDDRRIALTGGIWDMANVDQSPNPQQYRHCKPPREGGLPPKHENDFFFGMAMRFSHVEGMTVKGVTVRNPTSYGMAFCHTSYFLVDDITFDYKTCNPIFLNMDGVHFDGYCHHGRVSNLRGTCFDDLVALNANDGQCAQEEGDITDVDIDGVYADYCHSAVRLLSTGANLKRVTIRNVHGNFYTYAVGLTHFFGERKTRGVFDDIVISDVFMGKVFSPENIGVHSRTNYPPIWVQGAVDVGKLTISNLNRDERHVPVSTIRVDAPASIGQLIVRDCKIVNRLDAPLEFLDIRGRVDDRVLEDNVFIPSPGEIVVAKEALTFNNPVLADDWADPAVYAGGDGRFYTVASKLMTVCSSENLVEWTDLGIDPLKNEARERLMSYSKTLWAPCVVRLGGRWVLYISQFRSDRECRIVALMADRPEGPYSYGSEVIDSRQVGILNTIDPFVLTDGGRVWMFFGSCADGIHRVALAADGLSVEEGRRPVHVAGRRNPGRRIWGEPGTWEGSYLLNRNGWWYLFLSGGRYNDHTYHLLVGRSRTVDGVFLDREGHTLTEACAKPILASEEGDVCYGPGHNGEVFTSTDGRDYIFYHCHLKSLSAEKRPTFLQELIWTPDDWPTFENGRPKMVERRAHFACPGAVRRPVRDN